MLVCQHCSIPISRNNGPGRNPKWCSIHRFKYHREPKPKRIYLKSPKRLQAIELRKTGLSYSKIADKLGISKQRVQQYFYENI